MDVPPEVPKEDDRPKWDNKFQYLLSCIGFAVGLGNVWRFPYLCQIHGGGRDAIWGCTFESKQLRCKSPVDFQVHWSVSEDVNSSIMVNSETQDVVARHLSPSHEHCKTWYGNGAFLIPYFIALIFEGIPLLHLELALGQCLRKGSINAWHAISPYLGGVGVASLMVSILVSLYYNTILTWVMWYFINSFQEPLPWSICPLNENRTGLNEECYESTAVNYFWYRKTLNITPDVTDSGTLQWWLILCLASCWAIVYLCTIRGIETTGKAIYVTAIFPYLVLTIFLIHGLSLPGATEGLVYLFTPNNHRTAWVEKDRNDHLVSTLMLCAEAVTVTTVCFSQTRFAMTLNILKNPRVWLDAATQIFFSLSLAFGGLIAFSSYNPSKNDCEKDAVTVAIVNSITSLYASIPVFSVLGFKAITGYWDCLDRNIISVINEYDLPEQSITRQNYTDWITFLNSSNPEKLAGLKLKSCDLQEFLDQSVSGSGLAFIVFTQAIILMPGSQAWAILFFVMLFSLGLSSMFGNIEGVFTPLLELQVISKSIPKELLSGIICLASFLCALCFTLGSGSYWIEIFDSYAGSLPLLVIAFFEVIGVAYVYKIKRFSKDVQWMTGRKLNLYWKITWRFISPLLLLIVFVAFVTLQIQKEPTYAAWNPKYEHFPVKEQKVYPPWVQAICVLLAALPCMFVPLVALIHLIKRMCRSKDPSLVPPEMFSCQEVNSNFSHPPQK